MIVNFEWYRKFLIVFAVGVFFTSFCDYSTKFGITALQWIYLMAALTAPVLIKAVFESSYRLYPIMIWAGGYLIISILWYFPGPQDPTDFRQIRLRVLSMIFLLLMLFLMSRPQDILLARYAIIPGVLLGVVLNVYEQFHPLTFSSVPGRSEGLYSNINQSGCALMLGMIVSKDVVPKRFRFLFCLATGVGIVTTFSRGAILGWIVVMGYSTVRSGISPRKISQILIVLTLLFGFFTSSYWTNIEHDLEQKGALNANVFQRLKFFSQGNVQDGSAQERQALAAYALSLWEEKPIFGWGTGAGQNLENFSLGAHNMYLALMIDHGLFGALLMPWLLLAIIWGLRKKTFDLAIPYVLFIVLWGFFSHNVLEERFTLLTMALVAAMVMRDRLADAPARPRVPVSSTALPLGAYA